MNAKELASLRRYAIACRLKEVLELDLLTLRAEKVHVGKGGVFKVGICTCSDLIPSAMPPCSFKLKAQTIPFSAPLEIKAEPYIIADLHREPYFEPKNPGHKREYKYHR